MTSNQRVILSVQNIEREVMNGGFDQFFNNSSCEFVRYVVDALEQINCPKTAELARQAIATLGTIELSGYAVETEIRKDNPARQEKLGELDQQFFAYEEPLDEKLFTWIVANREAIQLS